MSSQNKAIRFIDSDYRELFTIPDGADITITYPPEDGRRTITRTCAYLDEYHTKIGGETLHICQFAEIMERLGARYEPAEQLRDAELLPFSEGEAPYLDIRSDEGKTRIGLLSGDFGSQGDRFHAHARMNEAQSDRDTPAFQSELHRAVYALRQSLLKDRAAMLDYCRAHPEARLLEKDTFAQYGFKLETETRQYFVRCTTLRNDYFYVFAYNKAAPLREREKPSVLEQLREGKKLPAQQRDADEKKHTRSKHEPTL